MKDITFYDFNNLPQIIEEVTNELVHHKNLVNIYESKLKMYKNIFASIEAINLLNEEEAFVLKVHKSRLKKGGE